MYTTSFIRKKHLSQHVWEFEFRTPAGFNYLPGQYAHFHLPSADDSPQNTHYRTFSITTLPQSKSVKFITRIEPMHSPYKQQLLDLLPSDSAVIDEPMGDMVLPLQTDRPLIFVAQGIAIASFLPLIAECDRSGIPHPITLLWAKRAEDDTGKIRISSENRLIHQLDFVSPQRLGIADILEYDSSTSLIYISGSEQFTMDLVNQLRISDIDDSRIIFDYFSGYEVV